MEDNISISDDIVIKQEVEDYFEVENNETSSETLTEPSTSNAVCNDESTLPYDHNEAIKEEVLENPPEINYDEIGEFCFESDHLALKSNNDYKNVLEESAMAAVKKKASTEKDLAKRRESKKLSMRVARLKLKENPEVFEETKRKERERKKAQRKGISEMTDEERKKIREQWKTIFILESQRAQAIKDLDKLYECQEQALADPIAFVECLQNRRNLQIPAPQKIHQLPVIDWTKYALSGSSSTFGKRQLTRLSNKVARDLFRSSSKGKPNCNGDVKPKSNQYWTAEEQKKLEALLEQFPLEEVESRRWEKIANCLENRTPLQVASRVQKYFIKLLKGGYPIPGRMPNPAYIKKARRNVIRRNPSTFMVSLQPPEGHRMPDGEDEFSLSYSQPQSVDESSLDSKFDLSDEEDISPELKDTPEYQEMMVLKKILKEKQRPNNITHVGFKCSKCKTEPILGIRWHCTECKTPINFCTDCADGDFEFDQHTSEHHLEAVEHTNSTFMDRDYMHFPGSDYNYLDPNYMPAT